MPNFLLIALGEKGSTSKILRLDHRWLFLVNPSDFISSRIIQTAWRNISDAKMGKQWTDHYCWDVNRKVAPSVRSIAHCAVLFRNFSIGIFRIFDSIWRVFLKYFFFNRPFETRGQGHKGQMSWYRVKSMFLTRGGGFGGQEGQPPLLEKSRRGKTIFLPLHLADLARRQLANCSLQIENWVLFTGFLT